MSKERGFYAALERFDELFIRVSNLPKNEYKAYAMIYFDKRFSLKEYRKRVADIKKIMFEMRKYPRDFVTIIEGGLREDAEMEFYLLPKDLPPPAPEPSLPSPQFMKNK